MPLTIPASLVTDLRDGNAIPVVGAGVSRAVRQRMKRAPLFPTWHELLENAVGCLRYHGHHEEADAVHALLNFHRPDYHLAATIAKEALGSLWLSYLNEQLGREYHEASPRSLALARAIWDLGSKLVITTNADRVLKWACPRAWAKDLDEWSIEARMEQASAIGRSVGRHTIWYLHGKIGDTAKFIITPDGYRTLYGGSDGEEIYRAARFTLRSMMSTRSFVFIGFSLDDTYFVNEMREVEQIFGGAAARHYVIVREREAVQIQEKGLSITTVTFPAFGPSLVRLVQEIGAAVRPSSGVTVPLPRATKHKVSPSERATRRAVFFVEHRAKGTQVVGRDLAVKAIHEQLNHGQRTVHGRTAALIGIGGLGKTQVAVEYAYRYRKHYPDGVVWITADRDITAQLVKLAETAGWASKNAGIEEKMLVAQRQLRTSSGYLIIFDNVRSVADIADYLPNPDKDPHIIVTSRSEQIGFFPVHLDLLDSNQALAMLVQEAHRQPRTEEETTAARHICEILEGLPLAVEVAGAYLAHRPAMSWRQYADLLEQEFASALPGHLSASGFTKHEADLFSTLRIGRELYAHEPMLGEILDLLAWSGPGPMGVSLLSSVIGQSSLRLASALSLGDALRLLKAGSHNDAFSLHRLVRRVHREANPLSERTPWADLVCTRIGDWFDARRDDFTKLSSMESEIDHLAAWQTNAAVLSDFHASRLAWLQAYPAHHRGRINQAAHHIEHAMALLGEAANRRETELQAHILNDYGFLCSLLGRFNEGLEFCRQALRIRRSLHGTWHTDTAATYNTIGRALMGKDRYHAALINFAKALLIRREVLPPDDPYTIVSLNNLGAAYRALEHYDRALVVFRSALESTRSGTNDLHPVAATTLNNLGSVHEALQEYATALRYYRDAYHLHQELFGESHPGTAISINNIGRAVEHLGRTEQARRYYRKALLIIRDVMGDHNPMTQSIRGNLDRCS